MKKDTISKYMRWLKQNNYIEYKYSNKTKGYLCVLTELGFEYYKRKQHGEYNSYKMQ